MTIIDIEKIVFSSGKQITVNRGFVGINPLLDVSEGYDGFLYSLHELSPSDMEIYAGLTNQECVELARIMIGRWNMFKYKFKQAEVAEKFGYDFKPEQELHHKSLGIVKYMGLGTLEQCLGKIYVEDCKGEFHIVSRDELTIKETA